MDNLPTRTLLEGSDVDRLTAVIHALLTEVAVLSERVSALESGRETRPGQEAIDALTARVLHPFTR